MPYVTTFVHVFCRDTHQEITVPVIDLGPGKQASGDTCHALDLTVTAFKALGVSIASGTMTVDYRIIGGAQYVGQ